MSDEVEVTEEEAGVRPVYLGMFTGGGTRPASTGALVVFGLAAIWALVFGGWAILSSETSGDPVSVGTVLLVCLLPLALSGISLYISSTLAKMRAEAEALGIAINSLRQALVVKKQSGVVEKVSPVERRLDELSSGVRKIEAKLSLFAAAAQAPAVPSSEPTAIVSAPHESENGPAPQPSLGLEPEYPAPGLPNGDLIRALNFPDDPDDKVGFDALRRALKDRNAGQIIQAAQDVLTLLSQDGIYMDDLTPDRARPEIWRRFAQGERGKTVAILGGIRDRSALALAAGRMRQDTIFRDSVHHFLRRFDRMLSEFEKTASDLEIVSLTDTRSARAFMLLGRVTGTFS